ncbi:hypothetical protein EF294_11535 [Gordonia oryzae]|uniref:Uncharacterized protein n=1 Tax=Gordonia oryzae TaxID=2487349 RepID=A0A3N4GAR4_9ACTN|nr:hypothetical protein [Gordonia oryzae]RPA59883.1 hypothetical protein EF294_11535 [Gordonia oryzae]
MNTTTAARRLRDRALIGLAGLGVGTGLVLGGAGLATAGTVPTTHPGEPTVAMTITNHTNRTEFLQSATPGAGQWVQSPRAQLAPGATEIIVSHAPHSSSENVMVSYRIGAAGPKAVYNIENAKGAVNLNATGTTSGSYRINAHINTGYPAVNVGYDLW